LSPEKGLDVLLAAAAQCLDVPFKVAGRARAEVPTSLPPNVELVGELSPPDFARFLAGCRVLAFPSLCYEGFPLVLAQAMAAARPVVCSDAGGLPELVEDLVTGMLFAPGDADALAARVRELWERPDLCDRFGAAGRAKARAEWSQERHVERVLEAYAAARRDGPPRLAQRVAGYEVSREGSREIAGRVLGWIDGGGPLKVAACLNPHSAALAEDDPAFAAALARADVLVPDGVGVVIAARLAGGPLAHRVTGSDLFLAVNSAMDERGRGTCFLLGATQATLAAMAGRMGRDFPRVRVAGTLAPPVRSAFGDETSESMIAAVNAARPDVLWVGMGAPKQETWLERHRARPDARFAASVGAAFDFYAGTVPRPSPLLRATGLEWLGRLACEPARLWPRTLVSAPRFASIAARDALRRRWQG
jgi:N-acetylglucosaminyldiphosphoundecaprenol N-acetyl-beta-D-mannosaminyltransferase